MARCCLSSGWGPGRDARRCVTAIALPLLASAVCSAQLPNNAVLHVPNPLRLSVAANVVHACGATPAPADLQTGSEAQLRDAGVTVSNIYNGRLTFDLDCVPVSGHGANAALAVHECLDFAQVLSANAGVAGRTFATTWRQCRSYTCRGAKCTSSASAGAKALVGEFLTAQATPPAPDSLAQPQPSTTAKLVEQRPRVAAVASAPPPDTSHRSTAARAAFFSLYVVICCVELLYWALRKKAW